MQVTLLDPSRDLICNPYAPEFLLGVDPETPDGCEDNYQEYVFKKTLIANQVSLDNILQFDDDFIIRGLRANSNVATGTRPIYLVKLRDVDGSFLSNCPLHAPILFGGAMFPTPWSDWYIPMGYYMGIEVTVSGAEGNIELDFIGVTRRKING